jgi:tetrahydromethanopterin S-methyltransferase subunit F
MLEVNEDEIRYFKQLDERQQRLYVGLKLRPKHGQYIPFCLSFRKQQRSQSNRILDV